MPDIGANPPCGSNRGRWTSTRWLERPWPPWLVAVHGWDLAGAAAVGCRTAFLARPGKVLDPLGPAPTLVVADLGALAIKFADAGIVP